MKVYISTIGESDTYRKILVNATDKSNLLILLYDEKNDSISLSVYELFSTAKCKVQFEKVMNSDIGYAFAYGRITAMYQDTSLLSNNEVLKTLSENLVISPTKKKRPARQKQSPVAVKSQETPQKASTKPVKPTTVPVVTQKPKEKESFTGETSRTESKKPASEPKKPTKQSKTDEELQFEQEFDKLTRFLAEFNTKDFDPSVYMSSIVNTAKTADREGLSFAEAADVCLSPAVKKKLLTSIPEEKRAALVMLIANMHDTI